MMKIDGQKMVVSWMLLFQNLGWPGLHCKLKQMTTEGVVSFIVVGQRLWFRIHVRCSFYHSIHKDNGGHDGSHTQVKKFI